MPQKDPRIDAYIAKSADFAQPILNHIRKLVHTGCPEVEETMKWGMPHFQYKGMLCGMAAFKQHCSLGFWKSKLVLGRERAGANTEAGGMGQFGRITTLSDLPKDEVLLGYIREAARLNEAGIKPPARAQRRGQKELVIPDYFTAALKKNKKALSTFEAVSYTHKKEYVEWLTEAKAEDTRQRRLSAAIGWLAEGKSRNWKYLRC